MWPSWSVLVLYLRYAELPCQPKLIASSGSGSGILRLMVWERGRWCLFRSWGGQPRRDVTRSAVTLSPSVQNNTRNQLLLWESLQHQGPDWGPAYPCTAPPCPSRTSHKLRTTNLSSIPFSLHVSLLLWQAISPVCIQYQQSDLKTFWRSEQRRWKNVLCY